MKLSNILGVLAVAGIAFSLAGCPEKPATPGTPATTAGGGAAAADVKYDPANTDQMLLFYAASQTGDQELMKKAGQKSGIYGSNGYPNADAMTAYSGAMSKYATDHSADWTKFLADNKDKWKDYVNAHMK